MMGLLQTLAGNTTQISFASTTTKVLYSAKTGIHTQVAA
jgi:hypothetical protein